MHIQPNQLEVKCSSVGLSKSQVVSRCEFRDACLNWSIVVLI